LPAHSTKGDCHRGEGKRQYLEKIYLRYRHVGRAEKRRILDEFCQVASYHRKYVIRLLNGPVPGGPQPPRHRVAP
jgi:hypothetical protein